MTCIAAAVDKNQVVMGGDSAGVSSASLEMDIRADAKVFKNGPMLMGFTDSFRMGQLLRYSLKVPPVPNKNIYKYMVTDFINAVRECLTDGGYTTIRDGVEVGGTFLVAVSGRIFCVYSDFQVAESTFPYRAIGCGDRYAVGALDALQHDKKMSLRHKVLTALKSAERHSAGVAGPFVIKTMKIP